MFFESVESGEEQYVPPSHNKPRKERSTTTQLTLSNLPSTPAITPTIEKIVTQLKKSLKVKTSIFKKDKNDNKFENGDESVLRLDNHEMYFKFATMKQPKTIRHLFFKDVLEISTLENHVCSLTHQSKRKIFIQLIDPNEISQKELLETLEYLTKKAKVEFEINPTRVLLISRFLFADSNGQGQIDLTNFVNTFYNILNVDRSKAEIKKDFKVISNSV